MPLMRPNATFLKGGLNASTKKDRGSVDDRWLPRMRRHVAEATVP